MPMISAADRQNVLPLLEVDCAAEKAAATPPIGAKSKAKSKDGASNTPAATPQSPIQTPVQTQIKSKKRVADHGEVFTNEREINAMLDLVKAQSQSLSARFLEPACGTGNFLVEILRRKLATAAHLAAQKPKKWRNTYHATFATQALCSIYGVELLFDNAAECRVRLLDIATTYFETHTKTVALDKRAAHSPAAQFAANAQFIYVATRSRCKMKTVRPSCLVNGNLSATIP